MTKPLFGIQIPRRFPPKSPPFWRLWKSLPFPPSLLMVDSTIQTGIIIMGTRMRVVGPPVPPASTAATMVLVAASPFSSEVVVCGHCLVTLSLTINETLKWLSSLPISMQESFWWWQCSDRYIISLFPPPSYPLPCVPNSNTPCGFCGRKALCLLTYLCLILRCLPLIGTHNRFWLHVGSLLVVVRTYGYTLTTSCWYFT